MTNRWQTFRAAEMPSSFGTRPHDSTVVRRTASPSFSLCWWRQADSAIDHWLRAKRGLCLTRAPFRFEMENHDPSLALWMVWAAWQLIHEQQPLFSTCFLGWPWLALPDLTIGTAAHFHWGEARPLENWWLSLSTTRVRWWFDTISSAPWREEGWNWWTHPLPVLAAAASTCASLGRSFRHSENAKIKDPGLSAFSSQSNRISILSCFLERCLWGLGGWDWCWAKILSQAIHPFSNATDGFSTNDWSNPSFPSDFTSSFRQSDPGSAFFWQLSQGRMDSFALRKRREVRFFKKDYISFRLFPPVSQCSSQVLFLIISEVLPSGSWVFLWRLLNPLTRNYSLLMSRGSNWWISLFMIEMI